ncbi:MAG: YARHG domain-containing protein [Dorea sp.]
MAFGKKKEKKNQKKTKEAAVKEQMVQMSKNPLYPEKQENTTKEILTALGTAVVCFLLVGVITMKFSYGATAAQAYDDGYSDAAATVTEETVTESEGETQDFGTGTVIGTAEEEEVETEVVEETVENTDYIIPDSDSRYISTSDLEGLTKEELSYARNEIYARHGRKFKDKGIQEYFNSKDWYEGTISPDSFSEGMLNDYEIENAQTILAYEQAKGYR